MKRRKRKSTLRKLLRAAAGKLPRHLRLLLGIRLRKVAVKKAGVIELGKKEEVGE